MKTEFSPWFYKNNYNVKLTKKNKVLFYFLAKKDYFRGGKKITLMQLDEQLPLRYRFDKVVKKPYDDIIAAVDQLKELVEPDYKIKRSGHHIWLYVGMLAREKHSPHLHLEIEKMEDGNTYIRGLFGPDPILWTLFIFLHFVVAGIFIIFSIIAYSKWSLNQPFAFDLVVMFAMVNSWFLLYFIARLNRKKGICQAKELAVLMDRILE